MAIVLLLVGSVAAAVIAAALVLAAAGRERRGARGAAPALAVGAIVLALGALNVYQYATGPFSPQKQPSRAAAAHLQELGLSPDEAGVVARFSNLYYDRHSSWLPRRWLGVSALQNPNDAWMHQEIIVEQAPDYIIEAGTAAGGGALLWATILREANPDGKVITIDIEDKCASARDRPLWTQRVEFILGSSTDPAIVSTIGERVRGKKVLVILDSDHRKPHVLDELKAYSPMVGVGGYVIVQDSNVNGHPVAPDFGPGPWEAIDEFLAGNDSFVPDRKREVLLHTMHPRGYLKRVK